MRWAGIDIGKLHHVVAVVDDDGKVIRKAVSFPENGIGFGRLAEWLGLQDGLTIGLEATGHYWRNLYFWLVDQGYTVVVFNPVQTCRFAQLELRRAKTDAVDAVGIARCTRALRPPVAPEQESGLRLLRELVRFRARLVQDAGDYARQLHRQVDLVFPELKTILPDVVGTKATAVLGRWPSAKLIARARPATLAKVRYDGRHTIGDALAAQLVACAKQSVAQHDGEPHDLIVKYLCEDIGRLSARIAETECRLETLVKTHELARLLTTIPGIGAVTAARLLGELGDPAHYASASALAADVGVVPGLRHSGRSTPLSQPCDPRGKARLRHALWMPVLAAVRQSPWLRAFYERLVSQGKPSKVALVAALRKLLHAIYAVARDRKPFVERALPVAIAA